jgi:hypothetical protein
VYQVNNCNQLINQSSQKVSFNHSREHSLIKNNGGITGCIRSSQLRIRFDTNGAHRWKLKKTNDALGKGLKAKHK